MGFRDRNGKGGGGDENGMHRASAHRRLFFPMFLAPMPTRGSDSSRDSTNMASSKRSVGAKRSNLRSIACRGGKSRGTTAKACGHSAAVLRPGPWKNSL